MADSRDNVKIIEPVSPDEIITFTNNYDMGLYLLEPTVTNHEFSLPNKLFEFIQARLAVIIGPSIEMARIVNMYQCGVVSEYFTIESIAKLLNNLDIKDIEKFKLNSSHAAEEVNFDKEKNIFISMVEEVADNKL